MSPSLEFVLQENNAFAQIKNALAGNATVTFQVLVGGLASNATPTPTPEKSIFCGDPKSTGMCALLLTVEILWQYSREPVEYSAPRRGSLITLVETAPNGLMFRTTQDPPARSCACSVLSTLSSFSPASVVLPYA